MAGKKRVTDLNGLAHGDMADADVVHLVDVSDNTSHASGTSKKASLSGLLEWLKTKLEAHYGAQLTRWPSWAEVTSKPTEFTPSSHQHYTNAVLNWQNDYGTDENVVAIDLENKWNIATLEPSDIINSITLSNLPHGPIVLKITQGATGYAVTISGGIWRFNSGDEAVAAGANETTELHCFYNADDNILSIIKNIQY